MDHGQSDSRPVPSRPMTVDWVVSTYSIPKRTVYLLVREGLVDLDRRGRVPTVRPEMIDRLRMILALKKELGVNMAGVEIILRMREQLVWFRNRYSDLPQDACIDVEQVR